MKHSPQRLSKYVPRAKHFQLLTIIRSEQNWVRDSDARAQQIFSHHILILKYLMD